MKNSHKLLLGFALVYFIGQSITFSIGHTTEMEKSQKIRSQKKTVAFEKNFTVLMVDAKGHITLTQSPSTEAEFYGDQHLPNTSLKCEIANDTCFVRAFAPDSVGARNLVIKTPDITSIHLRGNTFFRLNGKFDSLEIHNENGWLNINHGAQITYLKLSAKNNSSNDLYGVQNGIIELDHAKVDLRNKAKGLYVKLQNNSRITIQKSPDQFELEKDESSNIRIY